MRTYLCPKIGDSAHMCGHFKRDSDDDQMDFTLWVVHPPQKLEKHWLLLWLFLAAFRYTSACASSPSLMWNRKWSSSSHTTWSAKSKSFRRPVWIYMDQHVCYRTSNVMKMMVSKTTCFYPCIEMYWWFLSYQDAISTLLDFAQRIYTAHVRRLMVSNVFLYVFVFVFYVFLCFPDAPCREYVPIPSNTHPKK